MSSAEAIDLLGGALRVRTRVRGFAGVVHPVGVTVLSGNGFDGLTRKHRFAAELAGRDRWLIFEISYLTIFGAGDRLA
jgi:hypothetical protein